MKNEGVVPGSLALLKAAFELARDALPSRRRLRYGDLDFDWDHRVDTTWSNLSLRTRLREVLLGRQYQPTDALTFHALMAHLTIDFRSFTFVDLGCGKGRALLLASGYPFRRIVGVEVLPELFAIARLNAAKYSSAQQQCRVIDTWCGDARDYTLPPDPVVIFMFDPFPPAILREMLARIEQSVRDTPREVWIAYQNPVSAKVLVESVAFRQVAGTLQYAIFRN